MWSLRKLRGLRKVDAAAGSDARCDMARHLARLILLGVYTGTRSRALMQLRWIPSTTGGWVDLDNGIIHRRGQGVAETSKRQPMVKIPARWREADRKFGASYVVHVQGDGMSGGRIVGRDPAHPSPHGGDVADAGWRG